MNLQTDPGQKFNIQQPKPHQFIEYPYRWAIIGLMGLMFLINGLGNNALIPIAHKLSIVYNLSDASVSLPIIITFLVYSILNLPANHIIDRKGLRLSFQFGSALYMSGIFCFTLINHGFYFTVLGSILFSIGQPFIINCPAKIATYWFFDKNRPFATALMTGLMLIGTGSGFILPTLVVSENSTDTQAQNQIFYLYAGQFLASTIAFILVFLFMKKQPLTPPSIGAQQQKTDIKQSFKMFKNNKNLWIFFSGFIIIYGTLLSFTSTVNLQMKPYGYTDVQISLFALILIIMGVCGSIIWSLYLKKTTNYKFTIRAIPTISLIFMTLICIFLSLKAPVAIIFIFGGAIGFSITPILPISYDLGCQLSFPIGEAQVTGFLNGGAMIVAFIMTLAVTSAVKFGSPQQSTIAFVIYIIIVAFGTVLYYFIKIQLKRRATQKQGHTIDLKKVFDEASSSQTKQSRESTKQKQQDQTKQNKVIQMINSKYIDLNQDREVYV